MAFQKTPFYARRENIADKVVSRRKKPADKKRGYLV